MTKDKEYIEREAAIFEFKTNGSNFVYGKKACNAIISRLKTIPAADVAEVRHGEWKFDGEDWFCNKCNHNALCDKDTGEVVLSNTCPNCGAKMDGGADDEQ